MRLFLSLACFIIAVITGSLQAAAGAQPTYPSQSIRPLALHQSHYRLRAGERLTISAEQETLDFVRNARSRTLRVNRTIGSGFVFGSDSAGNTLLLAASLAMTPGQYSLSVSAVSEGGEERTANLDVTLDPMLPVPSTATRPPVLLLNGWQVLSSLKLCMPSSSGSSNPFGSLEDQLKLTDGVPVVYFFDNCVEDPNASIEDLGNALGQVLALIRYDTGAPVPQVDLVAHSMGGLIVRSYLAGLQSNGTLIPPADPPVRKFVEIATPNFGSFVAANFSDVIDLMPGPQSAEMIPGSAFLWELATWNQRTDDLRGVDALAIIGNAGYWDTSILSSTLPNASDGVVSLTSASLSFARDSSRTKILPYCHIPPSSWGANSLLGTMNCSGNGIANVDTSPETGQIVRSFLAGTSDWMSIGSTPNQDPYLSQYGGFYFADATASDQWVSDFTSILFGTVPLALGGGAFYQDFVSGKDTFHMNSRSLGSLNCGPVSEPVGYFTIWRCKSVPLISSVTPLLPNTSARVVPSGQAISISGSGFGSQQCTICQVEVSNPTLKILNVLAWTDQVITAFLPGDYSGIVQLAVQTANGSDAINIMTAVAQQQLPPTLTISKTHTGNFTQGQADSVYTVTVSSGSSAGPTSGAVTVTEVMPSGLTLVAMSGSGWTCSSNICTRNDSLNAGASYPPISVAVNVAPNAPPQVTNQVSVSGGGSATASASDTTTIVAASVAPSVNAGGIINNASFVPGAPVAPGSIVAVYGNFLQNTSLTAQSVPWPKNLGGASIQFAGGITAPLYYLSSGQVDLLVPWELAGQSQTTLTVNVNGETSSPQTVQLAQFSPGIFSINGQGTGQGAIIDNSTYLLVDPSNPATAGTTIVQIFCTGLGPVTNQPVSGAVAPVNPLAVTIGTPTVTIGGVQAQVLFSGLAPGFVGEYQVDALVPATTPTGNAVAVVLSIAGSVSNTVAIAVVR